MLGDAPAGVHSLYWDTLNTTNGQHRITASATDTIGLVGNLAAVYVNVDISHPPM